MTVIHYHGYTINAWPIVLNGQRAYWWRVDREDGTEIHANIAVRELRQAVYAAKMTIDREMREQV